MSAGRTTASAPWSGALVAVALLAWALLVTVRLAAPDDLLTRDQQRVAAYVLDATERGHWLFQEDFQGNVSSKPPLFTWIAAAATELLGRLDRLALAAPSWLASGLTLLMVMWAAGRAFGRTAAGWAALLYLFSQLGLRQVLLVRSDTVFQCAVFATSLAAWRAWEGRGGWARAWLCGALATLTKGPLGLLLVAFGFAAVAQERRGGRAPAGPGRACRQWPGVLLFVALTGGWFVVADLAMGGRVWDKLIVDELVGHAVGTKDDFGYPGQRFSRPWAWYLTRLAPMSLLAVLGMVRVFRRPAADDSGRRLERFLTWQVLLGLLLFALASENRFVHLLPLMPGSAVLAGRELARLQQGRWPGLPIVRLQLGVAMLAVVAAALYLIVFDAGTYDIRRGADLQRFAAAVERSLADGVTPLRDQVPDALYAHLDTWPEPELGLDAIAGRFVDDPRCAVVTSRPTALGAILPADVRRPYVEMPFGDGRLALFADARAVRGEPDDAAGVDPLRGALLLALAALLLGVAARPVLRSLRAAAP